MRMRILLPAAITVRITLIHNPGAGRQHADDAAKLEKFLRDHGHEVRYQSAKEDGWKRALKKPADLVVVAGGDGTVGKVARRMVGRGVPVGVLPSGTANNIARTLGLLDRPFEELVRAWERPRRGKLDAGKPARGRAARRRDRPRSRARPAALLPGALAGEPGAAGDAAHAARPAATDRMDRLPAAYRRQAAAQGQGQAEGDRGPGRSPARRRRGRVPGSRLGGLYRRPPRPAIQR